MTKKKFLNYIPFFFLVVFVILTRFYGLDHPPKVVFDEVHFGLYATKYLSNSYYFDIHPPLGKMFFGLIAFLTKAEKNPDFNFSPGSDYEDFNFLPLRFLTALFGSLFVLLIYFLVKELGFSQKAAFLASFLILFDNAFLIQSRLILMDIILLFFIFLSLFLFVLEKKSELFSKKWYLFNLLLGLSLGAAISIKLIGLGAMLIVWFWNLFQRNILLKSKKEILIRLALTFFVPFFLYFLFFAMHFQLASSPCLSNCGDVLEFSHHTKEQREEQKMFFNVPPEGNLIAKFWQTQMFILGGNLTGQITFYRESDWYSWPFMIRPIKYFSEIEEGRKSSIFFLGNPLVWWLAIIGLLSFLYLLAKNYFYKLKLNIPKAFYSTNCYFLFSSYLLYFLPFASIQRFTLLYHYLPALVLSIILFSVFFDEILKTFLSEKKANFLFFGLLVSVFLIFLFFAPLTYAFPLSETAFELRMWLPTWNF